MLVVTASGNVGRDAETRHVKDTTVTSFSLATQRGRKDPTVWVDCNIWGKRGESLADHITKGTKATIVGELSTREHNGKTYLQVRVDHFAFGGGSGSNQRDEPAPAAETSNPTGAGGAPDDDTIPF